MKLPHLNNREQLLIALVIVVLVLGAYGLLRFWPVNNAIADLQKSAEATQKRLLKAIIPEEPAEDIDMLIAQLEDQDRAMALVRAQAEVLEQRLAPFDSQETIVAISQLARATQVRIRTNETMKPKTQGAEPLSAVKNKKAKKVKKAKSTTDSQHQNLPVILPESAGWIARMSPGTMFHRPIQRIELEGSYVAIRKFIHGLDDLPYQVTVLRLKIEKIPALAPAGSPQTLLCELVLAL